MTLDEFLKEAELRCEKATPDPWVVQGGLSEEEACVPGGTAAIVVAIDKDEEGEHTPILIAELDCNPEQDADFIAYARTDLPRALSIIRRQREALKVAREALEEFRLGHEHGPKLAHTRALGDTYGWCDYCVSRVAWGPGAAEETLAVLDAMEKEIP